MNKNIILDFWGVLFFSHCALGFMGYRLRMHRAAYVMAVRFGSLFYLINPNEMVYIPCFYSYCPAWPRVFHACLCKLAAVWIDNPPGGYPYVVF